MTITTRLASTMQMIMNDQMAIQAHYISIINICVKDDSIRYACSRRTQADEVTNGGTLSPQTAHNLHNRNIPRGPIN